MTDEPWFRSRPVGSSHEPSFGASSRQIGLVVFLTSLGILFAASIVAFLVTRSGQQVWRTDEHPGLPGGLVGSTLFLIGVSAALHRAVIAIRANRTVGLQKWLALAAFFAVAFVVGQCFNWSTMLVGQTRAQTQTLYVATFLGLTGLHAVHVLGGLFPLAFVLMRARQAEYSSSRHEGVRLVVQYWHFLLVVWVVLLGTLFVTT